MKRYFCECGQEVFLNNLFCEQCGRDLAFDPSVRTMWSGELMPQGFVPHIRGKRSELVFKPCSNRHYPVNCNWTVDAKEGHEQCMSCRTTRTIPDQSMPKNPRRWRALERAKRHLFVTLMNLKLPIESAMDKPNGLVFDFLEDKRTNPNIEFEHVLTGHQDGTITLNAAEADEGFLHTMKEQMGEAYRTVLGHFRHEIGHYYWDILINTDEKLERFRDVFGDEREDYAKALEKYYKSKKKGQHSRFITSYASSHPFEDWAETWAHYLHIVDTLDTAVSYGLSVYVPKVNDFENWFNEWSRVTQIMNALNRSMGLADAYPFILTSAVRNKLRLIDDYLDEYTNPNAFKTQESNKKA